MPQRFVTVALCLVLLLAGTGLVGSVRHVGRTEADHNAGTAQTDWLLRIVCPHDQATDEAVVPAEKRFARSGLLSRPQWRLARAEDPQSQQSLVPQPDAGPGRKPLAVLPETLGRELDGTTPLNPEGTVLIDVKSRRVVLRTEVACQDCILEMLLVPEGNREHETILRIRSKAYVIHTALLALGLEPGKPAEFSPKFIAPTGPEINLQLVWLDDQGMIQRADASDWIRNNVHRYYSAPLSGPPPGLKLPYKNLRWDRFNNEILWYGPMTEEDRTDLLSKWEKDEYKKAIHTFYAQGQSVPMKASFVFVGSSMYKDEETGEEFYQAEGGHLFCTSNFPDALLDIREESSASDGGQAYEAWTEKIPPVGTPVLLVLTPKAVAGKPAVSESEDSGQSTTPAGKLPKVR